ncbi:MAG TPA: IclR family transcriptional regulator [Pseudonocardiaceae bacterium]|nr:IclR family transcriptional regulator [Pseudonocardiaceae bacterium]
MQQSPSEEQQVRLPTGLIGSVRRALRVLEVVAEAGDGVTAKVVARRSGFPLATTYHLLNTLVHEGYLVRLSKARGYGLGYKLGGLHRRLCAELDVVPSVYDVLDGVHHRACAPAYYAVLRDGELVVAEIADSPRFPRVQPLDLGFHEAAHATSFGKVLLAAMPRAGLREYLGGAGLARLTGGTITRLADLEDELRLVRDCGVAQEVEEFRPDLACLAAPVRNDVGEVVGAMAMSTPLADFSRRRVVLEDLVRQGAGELSKLLTSVDPR